MLSTARLSSSIVFSVIKNEENPVIPDNAQIKSIEYTIFGEEGWNDFGSIMKYDPSVPVVVQYLRTFTYDGITYFALVDFCSGGFSDFYNYSVNYQFEKLRVTFVEGAE